MAALYWNQGRYADAEPLYQRSLAIWDKALGRDHPNVAQSLNNLALLYDSQGRYILTFHNWDGKEGEEKKVPLKLPDDIAKYLSQEYLD